MRVSPLSALDCLLAKIDFDKARDLDESGRDAMLGAGSLGFMLMSADLHKPLTAAFGKTDGMVEGKYKRARTFWFETPRLYLAAVTETGDRGSGWYVGRKSCDVDVPSSGFMRLFEVERDWPADIRDELSEGLRQIVCGMLEACGEFRAQALSEPHSAAFARALMGKKAAFEEQKELAGQIAEPAAASRPRAKRGM